MNMNVLYYAASCGLVEIDRRFGGAYFLHHQGGILDDGGSNHTSNDCQYLPGYKTQHRERQSSSYYAPCGAEISLAVPSL
jgi:hypothetical protein